ncbi:MAG TPA: sulfatase-like hydrolase/transferase [Bryobacteraceae bacterium]|nr:sulfatase-like hydrolase/transferase [Bryobacteraceae bacterium]
MRRDLAIAFSLANICYLRIWSELLTYRWSDAYLMKLPPGPADYAAVMVNVLILALVLFGLVTLARRYLSKRAFMLVEVAFLLFLALPLNAIRSVLSNRFPYLKSPLFAVLGTRGVALLALTIACAGLFIAVRYHRRAAHIAGSILVAVLPFCAITFAQAIWKAAHYNPTAYASRPLEPLLAAHGKTPRVLWFICDEWDYRLTFVDRNPAIPMPEIDRLRSVSLFADHAHPPGPETPISLPGYFTGRLVKSVEYDGPRELQVTYRGAGHAVPWSRQPNVFESAYGMGFNTALVGWFHPGCRILNGLTFCEWWELAMQHNSMGHTFGTILPDQTRSLFETTLFSPFGQSLSLHQHIGVYHDILNTGLSIATDPKYGFMVVHLPIPHAPNIYDPRTGQFTLSNSPIHGYWGNLALLDRTVGVFRHAMKAAGTWDNTVVLFTSDHPYRESEALDGKSDPRIPYILKMASQENGIVYSQPFNAILTEDLLLAVLRGEVSTPADAAGWLDRNRTRVPVN